MQFSKVYFFATIISVGVILSNQIFIQYWLAQKRQDARIINMSGRQRMYSQRLLVFAQQYRESGSATDLEQATTIWEKWNNAHDTLIVYAPEALFSTKKPDLSLSLRSLDQGIEQARQWLVNTDRMEPKAWTAFRNNQESFLLTMDEVVNRLQEASTQKLYFVIIMEIILAFLSLLIIAFEIVFIFRRINMKLAIQNDGLRRSNKLLKEYAHLASHDLKQPIHTIVSFTQLVRRETKALSLSPLAYESLDFIEQAGRRMRDTTDLLLKVAEMRQKDPQISTVNPSEIVEQIVTELSEGDHVGFPEVQTLQFPDHIQTDRFIFYLIIKNLLSNALKFAHPDRKTQIQISYQTEKGEQVFSVHDNGIGMEEEDQAKIFELFQRLEAAHVYPGTGMGLNIVSTLIALLKGRITVESSPGEGSSFNVILPVFPELEA